MQLVTSSHCSYIVNASLPFLVSTWSFASMQSRFARGIVSEIGDLVEPHCGRHICRIKENRHLCSNKYNGAAVVK